MLTTTNTGRDQPKVLLLGYNGANNTGAEALLLSDIQDVRAILGPNALITIPAIDATNLRRYVKEDANTHVVQLPMVFFLPLRRLVQEHDLIMLVEGSTYMDTWTSAILWAYLWTTHCAHEQGKHCIAYAVDAGTLKHSYNRLLVRSEASETDLIIARAGAAAERLRGFGVKAPIEVTADNAFNFSPDPADADFLLREWPEAKERPVGLAIVDFYQWPVVMRPWGKREDCYKWPYYFSRSRERSAATAKLVDGYAALADCIIREHNRPVVLIIMEQLDDKLAQMVQARMAHPEQARIFSSHQYNASQMTTLLRSLDLLVTSRYHACVLSLAAQIPQLAVGHDLRLKSIYEELGLRERFFIDPKSPRLFPDLQERIESLLADPGLEREALSRGYAEHLGQAKRNRELLRGFVQQHGLGAVA